MTSAAPRAERVRFAVFAKAPVAGAAKTRLSGLLGEEGAARLHAGLVRRALATAVAATPDPVELWCAPDETHAFFVSCAAQFPLQLHSQVGDGLGARMRNAFDASFATGHQLVLIGSDCPVLTPDHLRAAAAHLREYDAVITPAEDGGYVLVALARPLPDVFAGIDWGTGQVMQQTRERLRAAGARWVEPPTCWDVDRPGDYERLEREGLLGTLS